MGQGSPSRLLLDTDRAPGGGRLCPSRTAHHLTTTENSKFLSPECTASAFPRFLQRLSSLARSPPPGVGHLHTPVSRRRARADTGRTSLGSVP